MFSAFIPLLPLISMTCGGIRDLAPRAIAASTFVLAPKRNRFHIDRIVILTLSFSNNSDAASGEEDRMESITARAGMAQPLASIG